MGGGGVNFSSDLIARYRQLFAPAANTPVAQAKTAAVQPTSAPAAPPVAGAPITYGFVLPTSLRFDANYAQQILAAQSQSGQPSGAELMLRYKQALLKTLDVNATSSVSRDVVANSFVMRKAADESEDTGDEPESTDGTDGVDDETETTGMTDTVEDTGGDTTGGTDTVDGNTEGTDTGTGTTGGTDTGNQDSGDGGSGTVTDTTDGGTTQPTDGGTNDGGTTTTNGGTTGTDTTDGGTTGTDTTDGTTDTGTIDTGTNGGSIPTQPMSIMAQQALDALTSSIEVETDPAARTKRAAFTQIDTAGTGVISRSQLIAAATSRGAPADSAAALYAELDPAGTGRVTAQQFVKNFNLNQINISGMDSITIQPPFLAVNALLQNVSTSMIAAPARQSAVAATPDAFTLADANRDGIATKAELRDMVTSAGGTIASADALYASLNTQGAGGVTKQQFDTNMPMPHLSYYDNGNGVYIDTGPETPAQSAMEAIDQAVAAENDPVRQFNRGLFARLDTDGNNTLTKAEVERSVVDAGGTKAAADALYTQLNPNGAGGVSEKQFIASMPQSNLTPQKAASLAATLRANPAAGQQAAAAQTSGGADTRMMNALLQAQSIVNF